MTPAEVRQKAADLIGERGWHKGDYVSQDGRLCALGAILTAAGGSIDYWSSGCIPNNWSDDASAAQAELESDLDLCEDGLSGWNDEPGRTKAEVIAALRGQS